MEARNQSASIIINLGAPICQKLKDIFFPNETWFKSYKEVSKKFTELKVLARKFFSGKSDVEILQELGKYSTEDLMELMNLKDENAKETNETVLG